MAKPDSPAIDESPGLPSSQSEDHTAVLRQIARGSFEQFDLFVDRYKVRLVGFIRSRVTDHHHVEDLAQEVFMRVFRAARDGHYDYKNNALVPWMFTIANNCVTDMLRAQSRKPLMLETDANGMVERAPIDNRDTSTPDPSGAAIEAEQERSIYRLLQQLPDTQREVISLRVFGNLPFATIATIVGCPMATVKSRMRYGLKKIAKHLEQHERPEA